MRRAFFFIVAALFATTSFASIPRARASADASALLAPPLETRVWASDVLAEFERRPESGLTRALRQAYEQTSTTNASGSVRFLSVDPVLDMKQAVARPQMWNRYSYVTNNPVLKTDPDGRVENVQQPGFTKPLSEAGGWADQPSVSWAFNSEAFLLTLAADEFVIGPAVGKAAGAIGRFVGRFFGKAEEAVETGAKLSRYDDVTTGRSVANRATNVSRGDFAKNLESNGFTKTVSKDGKVTIFQKDAVKYTLRDTAKSTGGPTAEVFKDGKLVAKIRLEAQ